MRHNPSHQTVRRHCLRRGLRAVVHLPKIVRRNQEITLWLLTVIFTTAGLSMLSAAEAAAARSPSRKIVVGGSASIDAILSADCALVNWKADIVITRKTDLGGGKMIVSGQLVEALMAAGAPWSLKELGKMAARRRGRTTLHTVPERLRRRRRHGDAAHWHDHARFRISRFNRARHNRGGHGSEIRTRSTQNIPSDATVGAGSLCRTRWQRLPDEGP